MIELFTNSQQLVTSIYIKEREIQVSVHIKKGENKRDFYFYFFSNHPMEKRHRDEPYQFYINIYTYL